MARLIISITRLTLFVGHMYLIRGFPRRRLKDPPKPWITKEIFAKMKYKDKLYSKLLKRKQPNPNPLNNSGLKDSKSTYFNQ